MSTGSFRKGRDGQWEYHISAGLDPATGKYRQLHRRGFKTKAEAVADADKERSRVRDIGYRSDGALSFSEYSTRWLAEFKTHNSRGKPLAAATLSVYESNLEKHIRPLLGRVKVRDLTKTHVKDYLAAKRAEGLSETTVKHHYRLLCLIGDALVDDALLAHNVVKRVKSPKANQSRANYIDETQQTKLLEQATAWMTEERNPLHVTTGMAAYLALMTGMRRGEICGVRWSDVVTRLDPKAKRERVEIRVQHAVENRDGIPTLKEPKSKAGFRNIAIGSAVAEQLRRHRLWQRKYASWLSESFVDNDLVVPNDLGGLLMPVALSQRVTHLAKAAGVVAGLHTLRHTAVSNWIRGGMNAKAVQERAGHSSITVTMDVYGHLFESLSADEIEALDARILGPQRGA